MSGLVLAHVFLALRGLVFHYGWDARTPSTNFAVKKDHRTCNDEKVMIFYENLSELWTAATSSISPSTITKTMVSLQEIEAKNDGTVGNH